jgi:ATP-binding protein involved in chromosome partitioning
MASLSSEEVLTALSRVKEPAVQKDLVSLNMVKDVQVDGSSVRLAIELKTPGSSVREQIESEVKKAVLSLSGVESVQVDFSLNVPGAAGADSPQQPNMLPGVKNIVAVASGKGGVGKTTVAVNLSIALAQTGASVGLLDADIYGPNVPIMVGLENAQLGPSPSGKIAPLEKHGLKMVSIGFVAQAQGEAAIIWRGPLVGKMIQQFLADVEWGNLDYLIVDLPPGTGDAQLTLSQVVPLTGAVVVTTPQDVALSDARKGINMFKKVNVAVLGVVENMSYFICPHCGERTDIFSHGGGKLASEKYGVPFLGEVPLEPAVRKGGDTGKPIVVGEPESPVAEAFRKIAEAAAAQVTLLRLGSEKKATFKRVFELG